MKSSIRNKLEVIAPKAHVDFMLWGGVCDNSMAEAGWREDLAELAAEEGRVPTITRRATRLLKGVTPIVNVVTGAKRVEVELVLEDAPGRRVTGTVTDFDTGIVLAEMTSADGVKDRESRETLQKSIHEDPPRIPDSPWRAVVERAREQVAAFLGARAVSEVIFTAGGSESDNLAIVGTLRAYPEKKHLITTEVEHPAVLGLCRDLEKRHGYEVTYLEPEDTGLVDLDKHGLAVGATLTFGAVELEETLGLGLRRQPCCEQADQDDDGQRFRFHSILLRCAAGRPPFRVVLPEIHESSSTCSTRRIGRCRL